MDSVPSQYVNILARNPIELTRALKFSYRAGNIFENDKYSKFPNNFLLSHVEQIKIENYIEDNLHIEILKQIVVAMKPNLFYIR